MPQYADLPTLIAERCEKLGVATQDDLRALLAKKGVRISKNTMSKWCSGSGRPRPAHLGVLLDVLDVRDHDDLDPIERPDAYYVTYREPQGAQ